ncbi:MAG: winged helix-turn-helix transcriptional regulator [Mycobacterium sp.]|nr:winged helix-turn-helix transcriptional regulator [Mycobacterium sp.]MBV9721197.1 winged helix-turn-helix transcriptional regulator [Mycobacterium sp.]
MATSRDLPTDRLAVGQLLIRLLREFRHELSAPAAAAGYGDIRDPHLQIFGAIGMGGVRLTELAARAQLSLAATSELVNNLQELDYLERQPDPSDGRAKLICLTARGRGVMAHAGNRVATIEEQWSAIIGRSSFDQMCATMQRLLNQLDPDEAHR